MTESDLIDIEVAYALPHKQTLLSVQVPAGTTARDALAQSGIDKTHPDLDLSAAKLGVFGKAIDADKHQMAAGERLEIYRPLIADPKEVRKQRAKKAKS